MVLLRKGSGAEGYRHVFPDLSVKPYGTAEKIICRYFITNSGK